MLIICGKYIHFNLKFVQSMWTTLKRTVSMFKKNKYSENQFSLYTLPLLFVLSALSCSSYDIDICCEDIDGQGYGAFWANNSFPYVVVDARLQKIKSRYPQLKIGMTTDDVMNILGKPDIKVAEYQNCSKNNRKLTAYIYVYVLFMKQPKSSDAMEAIFLFFSETQVLYFVHSTESLQITYTEIGRSNPILLQ